MAYYAAPVVGIIDRVGFIRCMDCETSVYPPFLFISGDEGTLSGLPCDGCGWIFPQPGTVGKVLIEEHKYRSEYAYRRPR